MLQASEKNAGAKLSLHYAGLLLDNFGLSSTVIRKGLLT
jgi:hypothetical protein